MTREALILAVCGEPSDDTPRLVMADWLQENGDEERAEFIRSQIKSYAYNHDRRPPDQITADETHDHEARARREIALLNTVHDGVSNYARWAREDLGDRAFHRDRYLGELGEPDVPPARRLLQFERGFVSGDMMHMSYRPRSEHLPAIYSPQQLPVPIDDLLADPAQTGRMTMQSIRIGTQFYATNPVGSTGTARTPGAATPALLDINRINELPALPQISNLYINCDGHNNQTRREPIQFGRIFPKCDTVEVRLGSNGPDLTVDDLAAFPALRHSIIKTTPSLRAATQAYTAEAMDRLNNVFIEIDSVMRQLTPELEARLIAHNENTDYFRSLSPFAQTEAMRRTELATEYRAQGDTGSWQKRIIPLSDVPPAPAR